MVLVAFDVPLTPEHVRVNEYVLTASKTRSSDPFKAFEPVQSPDAEQEFELDVDHVRVISELTETELEDDVKVLIIGLTGLTGAEALSPPPPPPQALIKNMKKYLIDKDLIFRIEFNFIIKYKCYLGDYLLFDT
jgi:hypothetical protein